MKPTDSNSALYLCDVEAMRNNEIRQFTPAGRPPIALYRVLDVFYATDDTCTHGEASLADGDVEEDFIVHCPWHNGAFDIRTGAAHSFPCVRPLHVHPVTIDSGKVYVVLPEVADAT